MMSLRQFTSVLGVLAAIAGPLGAQDPAGGGTGPSGGFGGEHGGGRHGGRGERGERTGNRAIDPAAIVSRADLDGPPPPDTLRQVLSLTDDQLGRYTLAYETLMAATRPQRDTARTALARVRFANEQGLESAARDYATLARRLGKDLHKQDEQFDKSIQSELTGEQRRRFKEWSKEQEATPTPEPERRHARSPTNTPAS